MCYYADLTLKIRLHEREKERRLKADRQMEPKKKSTLLTVWEVEDDQVKFIFKFL